MLSILDLSSKSEYSLQITIVCDVETFCDFAEQEHAYDFGYDITVTFLSCAG